MKLFYTLKNVAINLLHTKRKNKNLTSLHYKNRNTLFLCFILLCFCYNAQAYITFVHSGEATTIISMMTDTDGDGIDDAVDIDDDNDGILDIVECPAPLSPSLSPILYFNDDAGQLIEYNVDTTTRTVLCTGLTPYGDIAIDTDGTMYGIAGGTNALDIIDMSACTITNVSTSYAGNALSFMPDGNMLKGQGGISEVHKIDVVGTTYTQTTWHDFGTGFSNGDFVFLNGKVYILWFDFVINPTNPIVFEVTVDASYNYVSHINLGPVTRFTFGLAKAKGKLYGVAARGYDGISPAGELFEIPLPGTSPNTPIHTETNNLFGATSLDESFVGLCDTDGDGIADSLDLDSDNDGISDLAESGFANPQYDLNNDGTISIAEAEAVLGSGNADIDNDGLLDIFNTGTIPVDLDTDTVPNYLDLDSDGDGIPDTIEAFLTAGYTTNDGDVTDNDADSDGVIDLFDTNDTTTGDFGGTFTTPENTDDTGNPDYLDTNSDNDSLLDNSEAGLTLIGTDTNGDGIDDDAGIGASYNDPDGIINDPSTDLANEFGDTTEVGYRENFLLGVDGVSFKDMFVIYPDQNTGELVIFNYSSYRVKDLTIYNLLGRHIMQWTNNESVTSQELRIPLENRLSDDIYIVSIQADNNIKVSKKIIGTH